MRVLLILISFLLVGCANTMFYNIGTEENPVWTDDLEKVVIHMTEKTCSDLLPNVWASPEQREYYINVASFDECYNAFKPHWLETFQQIVKESGADKLEDNVEDLSNSDKLNCSYIRGRYNTEREKARQRTAQARSYMARANSTRDQYARNNLIARANQAKAQARYANSKASNYKNRYNSSGCKPRIY